MFPQRHASFVEKREARRASVPKGSTAFFRDESKTLDPVYVRDISETGMLICDHFPGIRYHLDTIIYDIFINIPDKTEKNSSTLDNYVSLMINQGIFVRSYIEKAQYTSCYGIEFVYNSPTVKERLRDLVGTAPK